MSRVDLHFANATCSHCSRLVTRALERMDGVQFVEVDRARRRVAVGFDPSRVSADSIRAAMERSGYPTRALSERVAVPPSHPRPLRAA